MVEKEVTNNGGSEEVEVERLWKIRKSINSRLPNDISIEDVSLCHNEGFDPRVDAKRKQYSYLLRFRERVTIVPSGVGNGNGNGNEEKILPICLKGGPQLLRTALDSNRVWICPWAIDGGKLKRYCELLTGTHDFSAFVHKEARKTRDNQMTVDRLDFERVKFRDEAAPIWEVRFLVEAKGFGRSQTPFFECSNFQLFFEWIRESNFCSISIYFSAEDAILRRYANGIKIYLLYFPFSDVDR